MIPMPSDTLDIALAILKAHPNWYLFPIRRLEKTPPLFKNELDTNNSNDPKKIREWHSRNLGCNWGIALKKSKLIVVDVDTKPGKQGQATLDMLEMENGELPPTLTVQTPSGGSHFYFAEANGVKHRMAVSGFGKDVDSTNYVVAPGCWLSSGGYYQIIKDEPVAGTPAWFGEYLREKPAADALSDQTPTIELDKKENVDWAINYLTNDAPLCIQGQNGEFTMLSVYGELKDRGISIDKAIDLVEQYYNVFDKCDPLWNLADGPFADRHDVKAQNAYGYLKKNAPGAATAEAEFTTSYAEIDDETAEYIRAQSQATLDAAAAKEEARLAAEAEAESPDVFASDAGDGPAEGAPTKVSRIATQLPALLVEEPLEIGREATLCNEWVYCIGQERFVNRRAPSRQLKISQFDAKYNPIAGKGKISSQLFGKQKPLKRFWSIAFVPGENEVLPDGKYNVYRPSPLSPVPGDTTIWNEHLNYLFQNEEDKSAVLNWIAWIVQNPTKKPNHALLIVGRSTGTGKSFMARVLEQIVGINNTQRPKNSSMGGDFNSWVLGCRLCIVEEVHQTNRRENFNAMRDLITEPRIEVNIKNVPAFVVDNYVCMMGISNHPDALPIDETDRRWLIVETFAQPRETPYYEKLFAVLSDKAALAAIYDELLKRDLGGYTGYQRPLVTEAKKQMIDLSRSDAETWLIENSGNPPLSRRVITVQDVIDVMPANIAREKRLSTAVIPNFLRDKLGGSPAKEQKWIAKNTRARLWVLRNLSSMIPEDRLVSIYLKERKAEAKQSDESAADDFGAA